MMFLCHHACTAPSKACCCGSLSHCPVISSAQATTQTLLSHMQNGADQRNWRVSAYERKKEKEAGGEGVHMIMAVSMRARQERKKRKMKSAISAVACATLHQPVTLGYCPLPWVWQTMTCLRSIAAGLSLYLIIITAQKHTFCVLLTCMRPRSAHKLAQRDSLTQTALSYPLHVRIPFNVESSFFFTCWMLWFCGI